MLHKRTYKKISISWKKYGELVDKLCKKVEESKIEFDGIWGPAYGAYPIVLAMHHKLNLPVLVKSTKNTIVVDDISDFGFTLRRVKNKKTATLFSTDWTMTKPDFFIKLKKVKVV